MTSTKQQHDEDQNAETGSAVYVYGIVPGDVEVEDDARGDRRSAGEGRDHSGRRYRSAGQHGAYRSCTR